MANDAKHIEAGTNGRHFAYNHFKCICLNGNIWILIDFSLKFVPNGRINNISAVVQIVARRRLGNKPLSEPVIHSALRISFMPVLDFVMLFWFHIGTLVKYLFVPIVCQIKSFSNSSSSSVRLEYVFVDQMILLWRRCYNSNISLPYLIIALAVIFNFIFS